METLSVFNCSTNSRLKEIGSSKQFYHHRGASRDQFLLSAHLIARAAIQRHFVAWFSDCADWISDCLTIHNFFLTHPQELPPSG